MTPEEELADLRNKVRLGLTAACIYLQNATRKNLKEPAGRKTVINRSIAGPFGPMKPGSKKKVASTEATFGAYPRKVTGLLRESVTYHVPDSPNVEDMRGFIGTKVYYGRYLEAGNHWWLERTYDEVERQMVDVLIRELMR